MRETSSRSSTSRESCATCRAIASRAQSLAVVLRRKLAHDLQRGPDRRQRVAQLVAQHRQEFVLVLVGVLGARARLSLDLVQPRVLDRQRGAIRQVLQQRAVVVGERVVLVVARGGDRAQRPPARLERNREQAVHAERLDLLGDQRRGPLRHLLRRDRGDQHRVPGVEHLSREALPAPHAKLSGHLSQVTLPLGISIVDHRDLQPLAVG